MDKGKQAVQDQVTAAKIANQNPGVKIIDPDRLQAAKNCKAHIGKILKQYNCVAVPQITITPFGISASTLSVVPAEQLKLAEENAESGIIESKGE